MGIWSLWNLRFCTAYGLPWVGRVGEPEWGRAKPIGKARLGRSEPAAVDFDMGEKDFAVGGQSLDGGFLIRTHQARIAHHVADEEGGQFALNVG